MCADSLSEHRTDYTCIKLQSIILANVNLVEITSGNLNSRKQKKFANLFHTDIGLKTLFWISTPLVFKVLVSSPISAENARMNNT